MSFSSDRKTFLRPNRREVIGGGLATLTMGASSFAWATEPAVRDLAVLYSGDVLGEFAPCACQDAPLGGLARRSSIARRLSRAARPLLHLDAGNALFRSTLGVSQEALDRRRMGALVVVDAYNLMGLDAANIGPNEFGAGQEWFQRAQQRATFPFVSTNLRTEAGAQVAEASLLVERAGRRVGILGLYPERGFRPTGLEVLPADRVVSSEAAELRRRGAQLVIALSARGPEVDKRSLRRWRGVDLIISCGERTSVDPPLQKAGRSLVAVGSRGKRLGLVEWRAGEASARHIELGPDVPSEPRVYQLTRDAQTRLEGFSTVPNG